jgi:hypothetical protein
LFEAAEIMDVVGRTMSEGGGEEVSLGGVEGTRGSEGCGERSESAAGVALVGSGFCDTERRSESDDRMVGAGNAWYGLQGFNDAICSVTLAPVDILS